MKTGSGWLLGYLDTRIVAMAGRAAKMAVMIIFA
jgi:hypothetical protein